MTAPPNADEAPEDPWSVTRQDLFDALRDARAAGVSAVVATIVDVEGSAYRRPGAKMVIDPSGESLGAVTAGCLEGRVRELAADVLAAGAPTVHTFDLMDDEGWGLGLGCNGIIDILLEPIDETWDAILGELAEQRPVANVTVVGGESPTGQRVVFDDELAPIATGADGGPPEAVRRAARTRLAALRDDVASATVTAEGSRVFLDWITPPPDLLLFGAQNDVHPVARVGHEAGFRVVVASPRGAKSDPEQFPHAHEVRAVKATAAAEAVDVAERTYAVVMSHNALEDRLALASLLDTDVPHVGLMGPRERFEDIRDDLRTEEGRELTDAERERIATPVGLDLGGGEPMQIAISIVAEALAVANGREGGRLRAREGPIHGRPTPVE